jgi:hypothetical protein
MSGYSNDVLCGVYKGNSRKEQEDRREIRAKFSATTRQPLLQILITK